MGVVCAITPTTNPTSTVMFKALISIKSRNTVVFATHPYAIEGSKEAALLMQEAAESSEASSELISCMNTVTMEDTKELMSSPDISIILAIGSTSMVKAAHSYSKPAIGVGSGNTPAYVDKSANLEIGAKDIISSKTFDNGVICTSEQAIVVHREAEPQFKRILESLGVCFLYSQETEKVGAIMVNGSTMNPDMVGKSASFIADEFNIFITSNARLFIAPLGGVGPLYPLSREIAHRKPVFRILINTPASQGALGFSTSLSPSLTLSTSNGVETYIQIIYQPTI